MSDHIVTYEYNEKVLKQLEKAMKDATHIANGFHIYTIISVDPKPEEGIIEVIIEQI